MGSRGGLRRERQGRTSHGLQSLATAERRKASITVLYCLSLHTSYPTPAGDPVHTLTETDKDGTARHEESRVSVSTQHVHPIEVRCI